MLPELDLAVPAGQTVALVGATGAGKTTIAKLLARFYDPTEGAVLLDGVDLRELSEDDLRRAVVMVTQENFLFSGPVADNIAFGRPGASRTEIEAAAAAIGADDVHPRAAARGTTPTSASAAAGCRPGSGSWSRSPGRSWPTRRC